MFQFDQGNPIGIIAAVVATWLVVSFFGMLIWIAIREHQIRRDRKKHNEQIMQYFNSIEEFRRDFE